MSVRSSHIWRYYTRVYRRWANTTTRTKSVTCLSDEITKLYIPNRQQTERLSRMTTYRHSIYHKTIIIVMLASLKYLILEKWWLREINIIQRIAGLTASISCTHRTRTASTFNESAVDEPGSRVNLHRTAVYRFKKINLTTSRNFKCNRNLVWTCELNFIISTAKFCLYVGLLWGTIHTQNWLLSQYLPSSPITSYVFLISG